MPPDSGTTPRLTKAAASLADSRARRSTREKPRRREHLVDQDPRRRAGQRQRIALRQAPDRGHRIVATIAVAVPIFWQGEFLSGEANMSHSIRNLEHYHFRYSMFRRPGDAHAYYFGAAILSSAEGIKARIGDRFEIDVPALGRPLRNTMVAEADPGIVTVRAL